MPVSAKTGEGLDALRAALARRQPAGARPRGDGVTRLPIDRVFSMKGFGTVVTGTLVSGRDRRRRRAACWRRASRRVKVRGVQVHGEKQHGGARRPARRRSTCAGVEVDDISRGQALVTPGAFAETRLADAVVELLPGREAAEARRARAVSSGDGGDSRPRGDHRAGGQEGRNGRIRPDARPSCRASPSCPGDQPGARAFVRLRLEAPAVLARGDRYILRAYSPPVTIAGGLILDPQPPRTAIRTAAALARCRRLEFDPAAGDRAAAEQRALAVMLDDAGAAGLSLAAMTSRAGVDPREVERARRRAGRRPGRRSAPATCWCPRRLSRALKDGDRPRR